MAINAATLAPHIGWCNHLHLVCKWNQLLAHGPATIAMVMSTVARQELLIERRGVAPLGCVLSSGKMAGREMPVRTVLSDSNEYRPIGPSLFLFE
ncbi:hypothetical protein MRB53_024760 [Persea americana]|uniref:Uncharacterized protein n=1 Tax=Persea americana TaxID=3435 RepID=A0ACC2LD45_PERAE|nr:hypothetical protein MRB53_024760 [Persea americana]